MPRLTTRTCPEQCLPAQKKRSYKDLPMSKGKKEREERDCIVLLSSKAMRKFRVFLDEEVGLPAKYQEIIMQTVTMGLFRKEMRISTAQMK